MGYKNNKGFTVIELMIAVSVFAVAIVLVMSGVIYISRQYQQASTRVALEDASRNIHQQFIQAAQFSQSDLHSATFKISTDTSVPSSAYLGAVCVGKDMYIFDNRASTVTSTNTAVFKDLTPGLWVKRDSSGGCIESEISLNGAANLLPANSKTLHFEYSGNKLKTLFVRAPDDTYLTFGASPLDTRCNSGQAGREFCADVKLESYSVGRIK